MIKGFNILL